MKKFSFLIALLIVLTTLVVVTVQAAESPKTLNQTLSSMQLESGELLATLRAQITQTPSAEVAALYHLVSQHHDSIKLMAIAVRRYNLGDLPITEETSEIEMGYLFATTVKNYEEYNDVIQHYLIMKKNTNNLLQFIASQSDGQQPSVRDKLL